MGHVKNELFIRLQSYKRIKRIKEIMDSSHITHVYLFKNGFYYRPDFAGYTDSIFDAGIYTKETGIRHCNGCCELRMLPFDKEQYNRYLQREILHLSLKIKEMNNKFIFGQIPDNKSILNGLCTEMQNSQNVGGIQNT